MYQIYFENHLGMLELCDFFCSSKSALWRMFFGWRKTDRKGSYYKFTKTQYARIVKSAKILFDDYKVY